MTDDCERYVSETKHLKAIAQLVSGTSKWLARTYSQKALTSEALALTDPSMYKPEDKITSLSWVTCSSCGSMLVNGVTASFVHLKRRQNADQRHKGQKRQRAQHAMVSQR